MTGKINWRSDRTVRCAEIEVPVAPGLQIAVTNSAGADQATAGIRPSSSRSFMLKRITWPAYRLAEELLGHQYLQHQLARWLRRSMTPDSVFLECGPGDMSFRRYLPKGAVYNAIEFAISEFHFRRVVKRDPSVNFCFASVTDIPVADNTCDVVACIEILEQIHDFDKALSEVSRVSRPGATFLCSIANGKCEKVLRKGKNWVHVNFWSDDEFQAIAKRHGFKLKEHYQTGRWIALPRWLPDLTLHLPITSANEKDNCYFVYLFEVVK